jgi:hypothetical protein
VVRGSALTATTPLPVTINPFDTALPPYVMPVGAVGRELSEKRRWSRYKMLGALPPSSKSISVAWVRFPGVVKSASGTVTVENSVLETVT